MDNSVKRNGLAKITNGRWALDIAKGVLRSHEIFDVELAVHIKGRKQDSIAVDNFIGHHMTMATCTLLRDDEILERGIGFCIQPCGLHCA